MKKNSRIIVAIMIVVTMILVLTSCVSRKRANQAPSAVVNIYPSQSELVDENYFYSKWTASTDPEGGVVTYRINYARTIEGLDDPTFYETVETYFLLPNLEEGIWYWRVTAMDKNGNSTKSPIWTFTINGESLPQPVDPEEIPTDPSLIVSEVENTSFTLDWPAYEDRQNPGRAVEYVIYVYDQGQGMSTRNVEEMGYWMARIAPATTAHTTDTSHTFNNMNSQTLYDWVIVAQNSASQTSVVGSSQVRTGNRAPSQPELLNPTEGATDVATDVTLSWSASVDPDGDDVKYYVYIDMVKNTNRNVTVEGIDETEYQPEGLEEGRTYYWFIMAKDANGAATRTQTNTFMTKAEGMDVPNNPTPGDGTEGMDATAPPLLEWEHDKNGAPITYTVYMSANPKKIDKKAEGLTAKNYQIQGLLEGNTRYYWAIEAKDTGTDKTTRSGVWTFKTGTIEAPEQTGAITNSDGTQIELTYDKAMGDPSGKKDAYTVKKEQTANITSRDSRTITTYQTIETSKIERKAGTTNAYVLTLEEAIESGDKVFIDYTPGTIASTDGGKLAQYKNVAVTNRVPGEAPLVTEATASTNTIEIAFDKDMKDVPSGAKTQFSVQSGSVLKQIESVTRTASDTYTLTLKDGQSIAYGETVLISYAKGSVQAQNEAYLESFAGIAANNTVPAPQPQFVSGETSEDGLTVKVTFDRAMADPTGKHGQFHLGINETQTIGRSAPTTTIESATLNSADAKIIELGLNRAVSNGDVLTLDYTAGDVESADGAALATFTDKPISNRVPAPLPICTAATMTADGRHVEIGFSRDMKAPTAEEANQFGVLVNGYVDEIESATLSADKRVITLNLQKPIGKNNEVHLSYTKGTVAATNDGLLESFQNKKVNTDALDTIWVIKGIGWNYSRIQDAIDAPETEDGDIIMVATGTYRENVNFNGKALMLTSTWQTDPLASSTTIIDGGNNGTAAVTIGTEEHYVSMDRGTELAKDFNNWTKSRSDMPSYAIIAGFTIQNGAGQSYDSTSRENINSGVPCGINVVGLAQIAYNIITDNGNESTALNGYGIYVSEAARVLIGMNVIRNNYNSWNGAGIYLENYNDFSSGRDMGATALIAMNEIRDNKARKGAGIYIEDGVNVEGLNIEGYGEYWKHFNAPNAEVLFVEQAATQTVNSYSNNSLIQDSVMTRRLAEETEGANIYWEVEEETPKGTLTLRPETEFEQHEITLNLDYTIGTEYHNGSVVFTIGENSGNQFEITEGASVVIGEEATAITNYTYSTSVATLTGIKLEEGTVTLRLTPQETPAGTVVNQIATRDLDYEMSAVGDADGNDSVWSETTASTATFVAKELSIVTDIEYKTGNEPYVKLLETPKRLKVASETTVDTVLAAIKATDDSSQTYVIITTEGTRTGTDKLTGEATLIVTAEHGNKAEYAITINPTAFVRLETSPDISGGRLISRPLPPSVQITWHETISDAVTNASGFGQSTITVWQGHYVENIDLGAKRIQLTSTDPASQTVRETTIIDAGYNGSGIKINENISSSRGSSAETIIEGFTIKNAGNSNLSSSRTIDVKAGVYVLDRNVVIRYNLITENGTTSENRNGYGIYLNGSNSEIHDNIISKNYNAMGDGAGIVVKYSDPKIYNNVIDSNTTSENGAGIVVGRELLTTSSRNGYNEHATIYNNTFSNNTAADGAGVYVYENAGAFDKDNSEWARFNVPDATVSFVEHNTNDSDNNTYSNNSIISNQMSFRAVTDEGKDIAFGGTETSYIGNLQLAPSTATGDDGDKITITATYSVTGFTYEGSVTFKLPVGMSLTDTSSITVNGVRNELNQGEKTAVTIDGIYTSGGQNIVLEFTHSTALGEGDYGMTAQVDADGDGTRWVASELSYATLTIPPQYDAPEVAVVSPIDGTEFATTTVTFTWEATAGAQSNTSAREVQGISGYVVAWANRAGEWASATIDNGATKEYATDTLDYGEDYSWHVKAIGANGKTATTTPDATFITIYRLRDLGTEGVVYTLENDTDFDQYNVGFDIDDLPARFDGMTEFQILVNGQRYVFEQNEFDNTQYNVVIEYTPGTPNVPTMDEVRDGFFGEKISKAVSFAQGEVTAEYDTIAEAVAAVSGTEEATITLNEAAYSFTSGIIFDSAAPVTIMAQKNVTPVITGNDTTGLFKNFTKDSGTVTFVDITFTHGNFEGAGGAVISDGSMNFIDCTFSNNSANNGGGALNLNWGSFVILRCQFNDNSTGGAGGALKCPNDAVSLSILESTFTANEAGNGGAIYIGDTDKVEIRDSYFDVNSVTGNGGALYLEQTGNTDVDISGTIFTSNTATNTIVGDVGYGGALYLKLNTAIEITSATITANSADNSGGGIYAYGHGSLFVTTHSCLTTNGNSWSRSYAYPNIAYIARDFSVNASGEINSGCVETEVVVVKSNISDDNKQFSTGNEL